MNKNCEGCGQCCTRTGYPPFFLSLDPEFQELPIDLQDEIMQAVSDHRGDDGLPCIWLDLETKRCKNYEHRPSVCRDFEVGSRECVEQAI